MWQANAIERRSCGSLYWTLVVTGVDEIETLANSSVDKLCVDRLTIVGGGAAVKTGSII